MPEREADNLEATRPGEAASAPARRDRPIDRPSTGLISAPVLDDILYGDGILANGSRGYAVKVVQTALGRIGIGLRGGADGHYGPATRNAVMQFQREHGLIPTGIMDRPSLLGLDKRLQELDKGERTEALPAPRPLRGMFHTYLETDGERAVYEAVRDALHQIRDRTTTAPEANIDDLVHVYERLEALDGPLYANVLRALAATREVNAWAPTLLDLLLALPAVVSDDPDLRERLCAQLIRKLGTSRGGAPNVLAHVSPDSVGRLKGAPSFGDLLKLLG